MKKASVTVVFVGSLFVGSLGFLLFPSIAGPKPVLALSRQQREVQVSQSYILMTIRIQTHYKVGQSITVPVLVKNLGSRRVFCDSLPPFGNTIISLKQIINGVKVEVPLTDFGKRYGPAHPALAAGRVGESFVNPCATLKTTIDLARVYQLTMAGTYEVTIGRAIDDFHNDAFVIQSEPIQFHIDSLGKI